MLQQKQEEVDILTVGDLRTTDVHPLVMQLATRLSRVHGLIHMANEDSGLHIYLPDPDLLGTDGRKELGSRHLAVNADKYYGLGKWDVRVNDTEEVRKANWRRDSVGPDNLYVAMSMKTRKSWTVKALLDMPPISERYEMFKDVTPKILMTSSSKNLVEDEFGNKVPAWCGQTIPITQLPSDHPAIQYLLQRGFTNLKQLEDQFETCYCVKAAPESRVTGVFYSRLPGGMLNTPQGRIVFTVRMNGVRWGYQSRYITTNLAGDEYFWTHQETWARIRMKVADPDGGYHMEDVFPPTEKFPKGFAPHKYLNALGASRNRLLMGFDAAVKFNEILPPELKYCILVEGPLDAAKIGPPGIALMGKSMSQMQADEINKNFGRVFTIMDHDKAGEQCLASIRSKLPALEVVNIEIPGAVKDAGDLSYQELNDIIDNNIKSNGRSTIKS